jgi:hypothetical protein
VKPAAELTSSGIRGRLERYGLTLNERGDGDYRVSRQQPIAAFATLAELRAFLAGIEAVVVVGDDQ